MASAAEQLARNLNFSTFSKAKDLQQRILFTLAALVVYRVGTFIPIPGIDPDAFAQTFDQAQQGILGMFNLFAGGAVERMAIFALNLIPYITASIVIQVLATSIPRLEQLKKEGEQGRRKMNQYTRYLAVVFCAVQGYGIAIGLESSQGVVADPGWFFRLSTVLTLVGGTMFLMWLGEQITSRGVGNGISLIIFAGIVAGLPGVIGQTLELSRTGALPGVAAIGLLVLAVVVIGIIVFFEQAQRRLLIQYPKRQVGNRMFQGDTSHLPLKLNTSGVIPVIFASSLLLLPATFATFAAQGAGGGWLTTISAVLGRGQPVYLA
ncbi:MAG TPA: preprotein translocase subunit SecY, partial [Devosiaceae bacterium]|nr:preprotein translocase subunit SecY [Devosiaceae bacterium]